MKIFANKNIWKKLVIVFLIITIFSFATPEPVAASFGGELMEPICDFLVAVCDGIMGILHQLLLDQDNATISVNLKKGMTLFTIVVLVAVVVTVIIGIVIAFASAGTGTPITVSMITGIVSLALKVLAVTAGTTLVVGMVWTASDLANEGYSTEELDDYNLTVGYAVFEYDWFDSEITLPVYNLSPEEIFRDTVTLFDVNFFSDENKVTEGEETSLPDPVFTADSWSSGDVGYTRKNDPFYQEYGIQAFAPASNITGRKCLWNDYTTVDTYTWEDLVEWGLLEDSTTIEYYGEGFTTTNSSGGQVTYSCSPVKLIEFTYNDSTYYAMLFYTTYTSITINDSGGQSTSTIHTYYGWAWKSNPIENTTTEPTYDYSISYYLQEIVSGWYYALLIIGIVGMLSVLVYIGIRILLSSVASQKAKYKQMLMDWLVGMILLFTMHYIMVFANTFVDLLTDYLNGGNLGSYTLLIEDGGGLDDDTKISSALEDEGYTLLPIDKDDLESSLSSLSEDSTDVLTYEEDGSTWIVWNTNMMGYLRVCLSASSDTGAQYVGYTVLFIMMVVYTCMFVWIYIRRVIYMAFLTIIAPLVALTYPIDKANDGQAQGFNIWFKEYMFNLLLQPMHLLLYVILVSSALDLALTNPIYAIVALGFMVPAEKILRKLFNFSKAETPGVFGGVAGAALGMSAIKWLTGHGPKGKDGGGSGGAGGSGGSTDSSGKVYTAAKGENRINAAGVPSEDVANILEKDKTTGDNPLEKETPPESEEGKRRRRFI